MGPWALPWSKSQGGFETLSHLKDNLNNEKLQPFSSIYAANNVTICAETLRFYKLEINDELVMCQ